MYHLSLYIPFIISLTSHYPLIFYSAFCFPRLSVKFLPISFYNFQNGLYFLQLMSSGNLLQSLMQYPKDIINDEMVELVAPYLEMPDYNIETARRVNFQLLIINCSNQGSI